jgi:hypothetical protein
MFWYLELIDVWHRVTILHMSIGHKNEIFGAERKSFDWQRAEQWKVDLRLKNAHTATRSGRLKIKK